MAKITRNRIKLIFSYFVFELVIGWILIYFYDNTVKLKVGDLVKVELLVW